MLKGSHRLPVLPHTPSATLGASLAMVDGTDLSRFPEVTLQLEPGDRKRSSTQPPLRVFSASQRCCDSFVPRDQHHPPHGPEHQRNRAPQPRPDLQDCPSPEEREVALTTLQFTSG